MPDNDDYKELEKRIIELETNYRVASKTVKISVGIFIALLAIFFGITYKQIGEVANKAIESSTIEKVVDIAKSRVESRAKLAAEGIDDSMTKLEDHFLKVSTTIDNYSLDTKEKSDDLSSKINQTAVKCDNIMSMLNGNQKDSEIYLQRMKELVPKLSPFSVSGTAKDGDIILAPWGSTEDWNLMVSPNSFRFQKDGVKPSSEYTLLGAICSFDPHEINSWKIVAYSIHKFGNGTQQSPATVSYLLTPKGQKQKNK